ncbi:hypothetical protein ACVWVY_007127 [Bradyrhizobium sp. URHC0002]
MRTELPLKSTPPDVPFDVLMAAGPCYFWPPYDHPCH